MSELSILSSDPSLLLKSSQHSQQLQCASVSPYSNIKKTEYSDMLTIRNQWPKYQKTVQAMIQTVSRCSEDSRFSPESGVDPH